MKDVIIDAVMCVVYAEGGLIGYDVLTDGETPMVGAALLTISGAGAFRLFLEHFAGGCTKAIDAMYAFIFSVGIYEAVMWICEAGALHGLGLFMMIVAAVSLVRLICKYIKFE